MIAFLPQIYPDELVYSWFARYYVHAGYLSHKAALQELLAKRCNNPSKEFIGQLNQDAHTVIDEIISMDRLVMQHTMFPQYARFIPTAEKREALYKLGHEFPDPHHLFSILPRAESEQYLKYCPICVQEDRQKYGETYFHRKHQIRNMVICPRHKCKLEDSNVSAKSEQEYTLSPAEISVEDRAVCYVNDPILIQFAEYMETVFDAPMDFENDVPLSAILYHGLKQTKYLKPSGRSRYTKRLSEDLRILFQKIGLPEIATMTQIQRILLGERFDFSATCQIAFFLGMGPDELTHSKLTKEEIRQEQGNHYMKNHEAVDWIALDEKTAPAMEQLCKRVYYGGMGRPERVGEKLVYRELKLLGHQLDCLPKTRAIYERYTESYPESWARKLIWAYEKLKAERNDSPFYWSDMRMLSGVKKKHFGAIKPYLTKHTDSKTAATIIALVEAM